MVTLLLWMVSSDSIGWQLASCLVAERVPETNKQTDRLLLQNVEKWLPTKIRLPPKTSEKVFKESVQKRGKNLKKSSVSVASLVWLARIKIVEIHKVLQMIRIRFLSVSSQILQNRASAISSSTNCFFWSNFTVYLLKIRSRLTSNRIKNHEPRLFLSHPNFDWFPLFALLYSRKLSDFFSELAVCRKFCFDSNGLETSIVYSLRILKMKFFSSSSLLQVFWRSEDFCIH